MSLEYVTGALKAMIQKVRGKDSFEGSTGATDATGATSTGALWSMATTPAAPSTPAPSSTAKWTQAEWAAAENAVNTPTPPPPPPPRTIQDDIWQALGYVGDVLFILIYLALAYRFSSFASNELLHKPTPYRALSAIYTFIFAPIFIPYYSYRALQAYWKKEEAPRVYSFFPIYPYKPGEEVDFMKSIVGFPEDMADPADPVTLWKQSKVEADDAAAQAKLLISSFTEAMKSKEDRITGK